MNEEENVWAILILAWLCKVDVEKVNQIKVDIIPKDNKELRNLIQQKISEIEGELNYD